MNYIEMNAILGGLVEVSGLNGYETKLIIKKNIIAFSAELNPLAEQQNELKSLISELESDRKKLLKKYSDDKGVFIEEKQSEHDAEYDELNVKHKDSLDKFNEQSKQFNELMLKESDIKLIMIPQSKIIQYDPTISDENFNRIFKLIDETK